MSRNPNSKKLASEPKPRSRQSASKERRTDESVIREIEPQEGPRTLRTGSPLAGSEVLEAIGSNGHVGRAMHDVIHTPDDEKVVHRLGPEQGATIAFRPDHALGDAGAEFAEEFGREFLMAATTGEDIGEIEDKASRDSSDGSPVLQEAGMSIDVEDLTDFAEPIEDDGPPSRRQ
jgi:hypothetical protein